MQLAHLFDLLLAYNTWAVMVRGFNTKHKTSTLMKSLIKVNNLDSFIRDKKSELKVPRFCDYIQSVCDDRHISAERIIKLADIDRTYGHQIFNGTRKPSRDNVLKLALAFKFSIEETQRLLCIADRSALYPRLERDAVIILSINKGYDVQKVQEILFEHNLSLLGKNKTYEELS